MLQEEVDILHLFHTIVRDNNANPGYIFNYPAIETSQSDGHCTLNSS